MSIYLYSPVVGPTGGTELLQQFCYVARMRGYDAKILYPKDPAGSPILERFGFYENPYTTVFPDNQTDALIVPEHFTEVSSSVKAAKRAIWWMSVDNYWGAPYSPDGYSYRDLYRIARRFLYKPQHIRNLSNFKDYYHFYQSEYAREYLSGEFGLSSTQLFPLSDYIDCRYCFSQSRKMTDRVLYNPKKGLKFTRQLISAAPDLNWTPLEGMTIESLVNTMQTSKLYIDFGNHPGKDRMPREAASCGCCVITGMRGAARNSVDIEIPDQYKFEKFDVNEILRTIRYVLSDYQSCFKDFDSYRAKINCEKDVFIDEVIRVCEMFEQ